MNASPDSPSLPGAASLTQIAQQQLRQRIGAMCHGIRIAVIGYALWDIVQLARYWSNAELVRRSYSHLLGVELLDVPATQRLAAFGLHFLVWLCTATACYSVWRLFTGYLAGRIFTPDATMWLRRIGIFGLVAQGGDLLSRPLLSLIVSAHMPAGQHMIGFFTNPPDLLNILFLTGFIALAHVFRVATEIADDNAQIV